mgnify:CR=1 FL=1
MGTIYTEAFYPIIFMSIGLLFFVIDKIFKLNFKYYLYLNLFILVSIIILWFPFTITPNTREFGLSGYFYLLIATSILYFLFRCNKGLKENYKNKFQIIVLSVLLSFVLYWFIKFPPHIGNSGRDDVFPGFIVQKTEHFIAYFIVFTIAIFFFSIKYYKSKKQ